MKKNAARRKKKKITTGIVATLTVLLVLGLAGTILYTQFFKKEVDRFFEKKYKVIDVTGAEIEYTEDELAEVVNYDKFYQGIKIDGVDVSDKTLEEAKAMFKDTREKKVDDVVDIQFQVGNELVKMNTEGMTLASNIDEVLTEAFNYAKTSQLEGVEGLKDRYEQITALKKTPKEYTSAVTIGYDNVSTLAHAALDSFNSEPVEAHATGFDKETLTFIIEESANGQSVNVDKAIQDVNDTFAKAEYSAVIPVEVTVVEPKTSADYLRANLGKVSSNSSKCKDNANRNTNIRLVCEKIDGLVLQPGEQFDFNGFVGERTAERGFKEAPGIFEGKSRQELGGGICQANTMIFQSVIEADLQVDQRVAHSWPSDYVDPGTDATVTWGGANFKFTNNTEYPVAIHAYYGDLWVTVEIYGRLLPDGQKISFFGADSLLVNEAPSGVEYVADSSLPVGTVNHERSAHNHKVALAYIVTYDANGAEIKREELKTEYPAIRAKIVVGTRAADGTIFNMNPNTGEVTPPDGYVAPTPTPDPATTTPPPDSSETPPPSDTQQPPETTPAPSDPSDPTPTPTEPAPTDPEPTDPEPTDPAPTDPEPTDPAPTDPAPTDPEPTDPAPTDPEPTDPAPTDPPEDGGDNGGGDNGGGDEGGGETPAE